MKLHFLEDSNESISYPVGLHIDEALSFMDSVIRKIDTIEDFPTKDIAIWCRGSSGAILATILAQYFHTDGFTNVQINHVKKKGEDSHSSNFFDNHDINIVIDDFVASGSTIRNIMHTMYKEGVDYVDYLIVSDTSLEYEDVLEEVPENLPFPIPVNLIVSKSYHLKQHIDFLTQLVPTELCEYLWDIEKK